ncbi:MAG TPA: DUF4337 domain-containing protein [Candidatus Limnocylindrales bacterium]|nr:DUF4337 domain-containing protein [Candidatus Limnocylindrales bacterium]
MHEVLEEHEDHRAHEESPLTIPVAVTISILAVLVAFATLLGHRASTEKGILATNTSNQWAYYQAKNLRQYDAHVAVDMASTFMPVSKEKAQTFGEKYQKEVDRYDQDKGEISDKAKELEKELKLVDRREDRFNASEVLLEIGLILCSLTLLTRRKGFWYSGVALGIIGFCVTISGLLLR